VDCERFRRVNDQHPGAITPISAEEVATRTVSDSPTHVDSGGSGLCTAQGISSSIRDTGRRLTSLVRVSVSQQCGWHSIESACLDQGSDDCRIGAALVAADEDATC
jgi:hypothetical protein